MRSPAPARSSLPRDRPGSIMRPVLLVFALSIVVLEFPGARERLVAPYSGIQTRNLFVQTVDETGPNHAAGIRAGDELVAVDGELLRNRAHYNYLVVSNRSFLPHVYELRRGGVSVQATVHYTRAPSSLLVERAGLLLLALSFLGLGVWVYLRRQDTLGVLFATNTSILAYFLTDRPAAAGPWLQLVGEMTGDAIILLFPACLLHFFLRFPDRGSREERLRRRSTALYLPGIALIVFSAVISIRRFAFNVHGASAETMLLAASTAYFAMYVVCSWSCLCARIAWRRVRRNRNCASSSPPPWPGSRRSSSRHCMRASARARICTQHCWRNCASDSFRWDSPTPS